MTIHTPNADTATPDLTRYYQVHEGMRRTSAAIARAVDDLRATDRPRARALAWYLKGFLGELRSHHTVEDDLLFPALAGLVPTFAELDAELAADHVHLDEVMDTLEHGVAGLAAGTDWNRHHASASASAHKLARFLVEHLAVEDADVLPLFERHFDFEAYARLDEQILSEIGVRQLVFTVPWIITVVDPDDARVLLEGSPAPLRIIWRLTRRSHIAKASLALGEAVGEGVR